MRSDALTPVLTGFYRFTDIMFEWSKTIADPAEQYALKAFLSHNSLGDLGNPLRVEKEKGLKLYIGTLSSGQLRLMFSSAQVEYIRYWIHAMGLSKSLLPIPSSEYLLTNSIIRNCSEVYYKNPAELKKGFKDVQKNNNRLAGSNSALTSFRLAYEKVRNLWASKKGTWLALDFEAWEMDHTVITEWGWSSVRWQEEQTVEANGHCIVKEHMGYTNGRYVPDERHRYNFGTSEIASKAQMKKAVHDMFMEFQSNGPLFLVFHDHHQDIQSLKTPYIDAPLEGLKYFLPDSVPSSGLFAIDTSELFAALEGDARQKRGLKRMCDLLRIPNKNLHNAGNDAHYTLLALRFMASGNQIDAQREELWPNQTQTSAFIGSSLKVIHKPWDEDSDYSDLEGAFSRPANRMEIIEEMSDLRV